MRRTIIVSAIALRNGGTLSILQDCLKELSRSEYAGFSIYALVKDSKLVGQINPAIKLIELNGSGFYLRRLYYEFFYFKRLSRKLKPDLWLSLHDISPNVEAKCQVVYCHNPSPFYRISVREFLMDPTFGVFTFLYWFLYLINIKRNNYIIVQQDWIRKSFSKRFKINKDKIIVAHPNAALPTMTFFNQHEQSQSYTFFYPTFPRVFKNIELICDAVEILQQKNITGFQVIVTIDGAENQYAKWIKKRYAHLNTLRLIGIQPRDEVFKLYAKIDSLIFPSKLETWGLPISEFRNTKKPILVADLPYAHETIGNYNNSIFFDHNNAHDLARKMECLILGNSSVITESIAERIDYPMANNWNELFGIILTDMHT